MHPVERFIDDRGGPGAVARATGYKPGAVSLWRHRQRLPRSAWPEIVDAFKDVTVEQLREIEASPRDRRERVLPEDCAA